MKDNKPYKELRLGEFFIREFSPDVDSEELKWHRDYEDRLIVPVEDNDWMYQEDNSLPIPIKGEINIKKGVWHRVIKGTTPLIIKLKKFS